MDQKLKRIEATFVFVYDGDVPKPKPFTIKLISERRNPGMPDILTYEATLPAVPIGTDVEKQLFEVSVNGTEQPQQELAAEVTVARFEVPQGSTVALALTHVDDGGNESEPRTQEFVANDTIPPGAPGDFGEIKLVDERRE